MFIVIELQTNDSGELGNFVWSFDKKEQAENKYYSVLSYAAVSELPVHSAVMLDEQGSLINSHVFFHKTEEDKNE